MKAFDINKIVRDNIRELKPYASARSEFEGDGYMFLDANENSNSPVANEVYNRYPDPQQKLLKRKIGLLKNVRVENIFIGNGSDEPIDLLIRATCNPGIDNIVQLIPTYGMYEVQAKINNIEIRDAYLNELFQPNISDIINVIDSNTKLLFICSPNNPTGNVIDATAIEWCLNNINGLVVMDEAYIDYVEDSSWLPMLLQYPNLVVLQTLSKAWGMASLRIGMAFASTPLIDILNKIKPPYNINGISQKIAQEVLEKGEEIKVHIESIKQQRAFLLKELSLIDCVMHVYPSDTNFILVKVTDANNIYNELLQNNIVVRNRTNTPLCNNCVRITIGTPLENEIVLNTLKKYNA